MSDQGSARITGTRPSTGTAGEGADDQKTIAGLKKQLAFLEKKLQIVGSITRHDVLNQMTVIIGYNELLGMMVEDPKCKGFLETEKIAMGRIQRLFQFAKDYQNIAVEPPRWQNIRNLAHRVGGELDRTKVTITAETGTASVLADPLFDRVFRHLFDFALSRGKTVTEITLSLHTTGLSGILVVETVGAGIPATDKETIFEPGYDKGTGWGLFLARDILAVTDMTVAETGDPGKGVRFEIVLPTGSFRTDGGDAPAM